MIAFILGLKVMPTMDSACFYGNDKTTINFMSAVLIDRCKADEIKNNFKELMKLFPKSCCSIR